MADAVSRTAPSPWRQSLALLCTRRFGTFWVASLLANIGTGPSRSPSPG